MRNIALVTGASSGMGKEFVREISKKYKGLDEIWVVARRRERLRELKKEIIGTRVRILSLDLMKEESLERLKMVLAKEQPVVRILVNASGYGISGSFEHQTEEDAAGMIHLNCEALTRITYLAIFKKRIFYLSDGIFCGICSAAEFHSLCSNQSICEKFLYCIAAGAVLSRDQGNRSMSGTSKNGVF